MERLSPRLGDRGRYPTEMMEDSLEHERLHFASGDGDLSLLRSLVDAGCDVNAKDADLAMTPLHYAAEGEHLAVVQFLLAAGADPNAIDDATAGDTPLGHVAQTCSLNIAKALLDAGADPLIPGMMQVTPLQRADRRKRADGRAVYDLMLSVAKSRFHFNGG
ncbi:ankyrin repeat domain-containing protein [Rosistilla oblonga]|uniref:ankyrin repeat domain-containing protein n=1 Tax=Rosistilla oblonga TaxID=2527990 RepID=UPI003A970677